MEWPSTSVALVFKVSTRAPLFCPFVASHIVVRRGGQRVNQYLFVLGSFDNYTWTITSYPAQCTQHVRMPSVGSFASTARFYPTCWSVFSSSLRSQWSLVELADATSTEEWALKVRGNEGTTENWNIQLAYLMQIILVVIVYIYYEICHFAFDALQLDQQPVQNEIRYKMLLCYDFVLFHLFDKQKT